MGLLLTKWRAVVVPEKDIDRRKDEWKRFAQKEEVRQALGSPVNGRTGGDPGAL